MQLERKRTYLNGETKSNNVIGEPVFIVQIGNGTCDCGSDDDQTFTPVNRDIKRENLLLLLNFRSNCFFLFSKNVNW